MITSPISISSKPERTSFDFTARLSGVNKRYPLIKKPMMDKACGGFKDFWALRDVSFDVRKGEVFGIIGRNGAGKSTLLNIIAGVLSSTEGEVIKNGRTLGLFNLGCGFQDELTGRENIFLNGAIIGAGRKELEASLGPIIEFSELGNFIDMPLGSYSAGMRLRLAFSIIVNLHFETLLIDEVLSVGDALFQSKCFQRLMDLRRQGKTLIITTQGLELVERLCDRVLLLDHGRLVFLGQPKEAIDNYRRLLNTEKFFVGPEFPDMTIIRETKKWADDISKWGQRLGTKEITVDKIELIDRLGCICNKIKTGRNLKLKAYFTVKNEVSHPHFGAAIFRADGVYCYGPNTAWDNYYIPPLKIGRGYFILEYKNIFLAPGAYKISVAIWDKNEVLAFDYHNGCYDFTITGPINRTNQLLNLPYRAGYDAFLGRQKCRIDLRLLADNRPEKKENNAGQIESIRLLNTSGQQKDIFMTGEKVKIVIAAWIPGEILRKYILGWLAIYRDDGILCQEISCRIAHTSCFEIEFPRLLLLPGGYKISAGLWDTKMRNFLSYSPMIKPFRMIFNKADHGTIYLKHKWQTKTKKA